MIVVFIKILSLSSFKISLWIADKISILLFHISKKEKQMAKKNIERILRIEHPEELIKDIFKLAGRNFIYAIKQLEMTHTEILENWMVVIGNNEMQKAYKKGKGVVCITAHLGCWELIATTIAALGYPTHVVARKVYDERLNKILVDYRNRMKVHSHDRDEDVKGMMLALRKGGLLGILMDQNTRVENIMCDFLGCPARTPSGPVSIALKTGAAIVPLFIHLRDDGKQVLEIEKEIDINEFKDLDKKEKIKALTERCNAIIGAKIMNHPEQWVWFHDRWNNE
ncbi:MAG: lysophospholipid acyltransferase family protein [Candidatus Coatesbacteria bacterium]|nr:lysophospholipid acyltransferase family protein [Candidatus Coatesbacteria bacterium]